MTENMNINFLRLCTGTIPNVCSEDPSGLTAFKNAIDLLNGLAGNDKKTVLLAFLKTFARQSKGRLATSRAGKTSLAKFTK